MPTTLITGASRGIGLGLAEEYARRGWDVIATCRDPTAAARLHNAARASGGAISIAALDVASDDAIETLGEQLADKSIDVLINNAAWGDRRAQLAEVTYESWEHAMRVNAYATLKMAQVFVEHVARSDRKVMITIGSQMGSIAENVDGSRYVYRTSKAAVNMVVRTLAIDLLPRGIVVACLHPGWVKTATGGSAAPLMVHDSARALVDVIASLNEADSGCFFDYERKPIPW